MPDRLMQSTCSPKCAIDHATAQRKKKEDKAARLAIAHYRQTDKKWLKRKAQEAFNAFVRRRDKDQPCISCGYVGAGRQWHAGHYRPVGQNSALAFDERNVHKQCVQCNNYLSGNLPAYRSNLIQKLGIEAVLELESEKAVKRYTVAEYQEIIRMYKYKGRKI